MAVLYLRNNDAIVSEISSSDFSMLSPTRWQDELALYAMYMQFLNIEVPMVFSVTKLYGFCEQPDTYTIQPYYNTITYYADATHNAIWYDNEGNTIEMYISTTGPSLVFMPIPQGYTRLMYQNGKELIIKPKCITKSKKSIAVAFWDLYGQMQTVQLQLGASSFSTDTDTDYRLANNGVVYYAMLHPKDEFEVGVDYVTEDLYDFYKGLCTNGAILAYSNEDNILQNKEISLSNASLTTNVYGKNGFFTGKIEMKIGDNDAVIL